MANVELQANDRLLLYGYGLFETLRVTPEGVELPFFHWQRLQAGAETLGLKAPDYPQWLKAIKEYLQARPELSGPEVKPRQPFALRLTLSGGEESGGKENTGSKLLFHPRPIPYTPEQYAQGVELALLPTPRNERSVLTRIKSTNYLENVLARKQAQALGAFDGVWLNTQGEVAETTMSNLFFVTGDTLYTPALDCGCLPGTRRALVLQIAASQGIPAREGKYQPEILLEAEEVFLTNALLGIMPVCRIEHRRYPLPRESVHSVTARLIKAYERWPKTTPLP